MDLLAQIRKAGFSIALKGENIRVEYVGQGEPQEKALSLLDTLKEQKPQAVTYLKEIMPKPCMEPDGSLVIPFESDSRYHWWQHGGQSIRQTENEVRAWKH